MPESILVIEDEPDMRALLRLMLTRGGFEVREVDSGEDGLTEIAAEPPDAVILDLMLPGMNGFGVLEALRRSGRLEQTKVLMLTAAIEPELEQRALEAGCASFLNKTMTHAELIARIRATLDGAAAR